MKLYPRESSPAALPKREEKAFTKRLGRLFFSKDVPKPTAPQNDVAAANLVFLSSSVAGPSPHTPEALLTGMILEELPLNSKPAKLEGGNDVLLQRFVMQLGLEGGHEHYLKPREHQERSSGVWRKLLSKRQAADKKGGPNSLAIMVEKYGKCQEVVGGGASCIVRISHKKIENGTGEELYAVKEFQRRAGETDNKYSKRLAAEFCISSELRHPNVIRTLDLLKDPAGDYYEVMEFCAGGDLFMLVHSAGELEVQEADCFFKQLMSGVQYMHEMGVAHRDLKPENLLLTRHGQLKISDFDYSECFRTAWEHDVHMVSGLCGSKPYIAPEAYIDKEFDGRGLDVWACGVIYMAMRTCRHLWHIAKKDEDDLYAQYLEDRRQEDGFVPIESLRRARCRNVIYCMLDPNPSRRITASQVLNSDWGREIQLCRAVV